MKHLLAILIGALLGLVAQASRDLDRMPQFGTLLLASFNRGDASDLSWAKRTPTVSAGATFVGRAADFGGTSTAVITYPDDSLFETVPLTVSFWARIDSSSTRVALVSKCASTAAPETFRGWYVHFAGTSAGSFGILVSTNTNGTNTRYSYTGSPTTYGDGTWRHFVWVCNSLNTSSDWRLYVNGAAVSLTHASVGTVTTLANSEPVTLGGFTTPNQTARLDGALDQVIIYNRALTAAEAGALYAAGRP